MRKWLPYAALPLSVGVLMLVQLLLMRSAAAWVAGLAVPFFIAPFWACVAGFFGLHALIAAGGVWIQRCRKRAARRENGTWLLLALVFLLQLLWCLFSFQFRALGVAFFVLLAWLCAEVVFFRRVLRLYFAPAWLFLPSIAALAYFVVLLYTVIMLN